MDDIWWAFIAAVTFMVMDVVSGFLGAMKNKSLNSSKMREGLFHKGSLVMVMVLAYLMEIFVVHVPSLGFSVPLFVPTCTIVVCMEIISILENITEINPALKASKLMQLFEKCGGENEEE